MMSPFAQAKLSAFCTTEESKTDHSDKFVRRHEQKVVFGCVCSVANEASVCSRAFDVWLVASRGCGCTNRRLWLGQIVFGARGAVRLHA